MSLAERLQRRVAAGGPMPVSEFMAVCLTDPVDGYYATRDPLGAAGDFVTAPEISQMFGEMVGLALAQAWLSQGGPAPFALAELGPGRGTLMADILRATRGIPGFAEAAEIHLVETSPVLRAEQARRVGQGASWHDSADTLPEMPLLLVANEFFDALPIRQFQRHGSGWSERVVGWQDGRFVFGLTEPAPLAALAHRLGDTREGDVVETCAPAEAIAGEIGRRIAAHGGAALIIDYGGWHSLGDTLQAVRDHAPVDPLAAPGAADLTAHVDFEPLAKAAAAAGCAHSRLEAQGAFLERLGITHRAQKLAQGLGGAALKSHVAAHRRLTHPEEMGSLFKVLGIWPRGAPPIPGLET